MNLKYINSENKEFDLVDSSLRLKEANFHNYQWKYDSKPKRWGVKVERFVKEEKQYELKFVVKGSEHKRKEYLDKIHSAMETDILTNKPGKIIWNDYFIEGFVIESNTYPDENISQTNNELIFMAPYSFWCREKTYSFKANTKAIVDAETKEDIDSVLDNASAKTDYPWDYKRDFKTKYRPATKKRVRDYKYDFYHNHTIAKLDNDHYAASNFKIIVYGPCTKPFIQIGGNIYEVYTTLYDGEYMIIDSRTRTIKKYTRYGVEENILNSKSREYHVFEKIPAGKLTVKWNAQYPFDVILYQERSEPPWKLS